MFSEVNFFGISALHCVNMLSSGRRRRALKPRIPSKPGDKSKCRITVTVPLLVILLVIALCSFSLYLSSTILPASNLNANSSDKPNIHSAPSISAQRRRHDDHDGDAVDVKTMGSVSKSLSLYLLRRGHDDRVEYMIGFRGHRISDPSKYKELIPRNVSRVRDRDYRENPVRIGGWKKQPDSEVECDAHCVPCSRSECDVSGVRWSMENVDVSEANNVITGSTHLNSLVPVPYFSFWDFGYMTELNRNKDADGIASAFISNCGLFCL